MRVMHWKQTKIKSSIRVAVIYVKHVKRVFVNYDTIRYNFSVILFVLDDHFFLWKYKYH